MVRAWNKKLRRASTAPSREWRVFGLIALPVAILVITVITLVAISTRPNLAYRSFPQDASAPGVRTLEWSTLYALEKKRHRREPIPPEVENGVVRLPGYMLPVEPSRDPHREVSRFLLVPDPGNWLHPAHADDGVLVSMAGSATTPLRDQHPVWVQGRLFLTPPDRGPVDAPCSLIATKVD